MTEIEIEDSDEDYGNNDDEEMESEPQPPTLQLAIPKLPLVPHLDGPSNAASILVPATPSDAGGPPESASAYGMVPASPALNDTADPPKPGSSGETTRFPSRRGDGWYVVYHASLPCVCYGV